MNASNAVGGENRPVGDPEVRDEPGFGEEGFVRNEADKASHSRFSLVNAFACAISGLLYALKTQRNMKIHVAAAVLAVILGFVLAIDPLSWAAVAVCIALVPAVECVNTALESVVDLVSPGYADLAKHAKDCADGAVLLCAIGSLIVACAVFLPPAFALFCQ